MDSLLVGRNIITVLVSDDRDEIIFKTDRGDVKWALNSIGTTEPWFSDLVCVKYLRGSIVESVEKLSFTSILDIDARSRQMYDSVYGYKLKTSKGYASILFRVSGSVITNYKGNVIELESSVGIGDFKEVKMDRRFK